MQGKRTPQDELADAIRDALVMTKDESAKAIYTTADAMSAQEYRAVIRDAIRSVYREHVIDAWEAEA
jgi:hypothetical protein